ncbi:MAG: trypsin-like peptidase domain-containing protein [Thermoguttaceae bacterium]|nr:trypsin-like peptidase domain-containing protein [Thermoguttaceae bacterium]
MNDEYNDWGRRGGSGDFGGLGNVGGSGGWGSSGNVGGSGGWGSSGNVGGSGGWGSSGNVGGSGGLGGSGNVGGSSNVGNPGDANRFNEAANAPNVSNGANRFNAPNVPNNVPNASRLTAEDRAALQKAAATYRSTFLIFAFLFLTGLAVAPSLAERIALGINRGAEQAKLEAAREFLAENPGAVGRARIPYVAKLAAPSVVGVKTNRFERTFFGGVANAEGQGSGVIVDADGFVITNFHVICENGRLVDGVELVLSDGRTVSNGITLIGFDEALDVAVLKIEEPNLTPIAWGDSDALEVGDAVVALGNPYGLAQTVTEGIVSAKERFVLNENGVATQEFLQTDAAINPGNSGGALVDERGELVGINTAIYGERYQGISFALPSARVREVYEEIARSYRATYGR